MKQPLGFPDLIDQSIGYTFTFDGKTMKLTRKECLGIKGWWKIHIGISPRGWFIVKQRSVGPKSKQWGARS